MQSKLWREKEGKNRPAAISIQVDYITRGLEWETSNEMTHTHQQQQQNILLSSINGFWLLLMFQHLMMAFFSRQVSTLMSMCHHLAQLDEYGNVFHSFKNEQTTATTNPPYIFITLLFGTQRDNKKRTTTKALDPIEGREEEKKGKRLTRKVSQFHRIRDHHWNSQS